MINQQTPSRLVGIKILENTQILFQNGEIDVSTKNRIASLVRSSMTTDDFSELNGLFKVLSYSITLRECIDDCIRMTNR